MTIKEITSYIEEIAPLHYAEDFDNVGLLVGAYNTQVTGVLVTLDTLEETLEEAIAKQCNLIVSFHPIIFKGLKKLNGKSYVERVVMKALKNDIAIYATHTALDNSVVGVSARMCEVLGLKQSNILIPKRGVIKKLSTYVPENHTKKVRDALFLAGAGAIGNYNECSFNFTGTGTFKGNDNSNPVLGKKGALHKEPENCIQVVFQSDKEDQILKALFTHHPYEEVAFEIVTTDNIHQNIGMGMVGELPKPMDGNSFLSFVKSSFKTSCIKHSKLLEKPIKKVAVLGGSGSFAIQNAITTKADAYISADFKYHDFFLAEGKIILIDVGHYESEQFTKNLLVEYLTKKITNFAPAFATGRIILSERSTNPIYYL